MLLILLFLFVADRHRPYLMVRVEGTNDYINAVFLDVSIMSFTMLLRFAEIEADQY